MTPATAVSKCCNAPIEEVGGEPDFVGSDEICTMHFECTKCKQPCDPQIEAKHQRHCKASQGFVCSCVKEKEVRKDFLPPDEDKKEMTLEEARFVAFLAPVMQEGRINVDLMDKIWEYVKENYVSREKMEKFIKTKKNKAREHPIQNSSGATEIRGFLSACKEFEELLAPEEK